MKRLLLCFVVVLLASCGGDELPPTPPPPGGSMSVGSAVAGIGGMPSWARVAEHTTIPAEVSVGETVPVQVTLRGVVYQYAYIYQAGLTTWERIEGMPGDNGQSVRSWIVNDAEFSFTAAEGANAIILYACERKSVAGETVWDCGNNKWMLASVMGVSEEDGGEDQDDDVPEGELDTDFIVTDCEGTVLDRQPIFEVSCDESGSGLFETTCDYDNGEQIVGNAILNPWAYETRNAPVSSGIPWAAIVGIVSIIAIVAGVSQSSLNKRRN